MIVSKVAVGRARDWLLAEVIVNRTQPVDRIAQETQVEEHESWDSGHRIPNLMARYGVRFWVFLQRLQQFLVCYQFFVTWIIDAQIAIEKTASEDFLHCRPGVLEEVIVQQNQAHALLPKLGSPLCFARAVHQEIHQRIPSNTRLRP